MKNVFWLGAVLLLLTACGSDDPAPASTEPAQTATEETPVETPADVVEDAEDSEEALEIVEESASEPEPEEEAIKLAQPEAVAAPRTWQFRENQHYYRLTPTQQTVGGPGKIEVVEVFWYGCPHCYDFEPYINSWAEAKPANVRFVHLPAMWNRGLALHAQLYYTEEVLVRNGVIKDPAAFREAVFAEYHRRGNRLGSESSIKTLFARLGVSSEDFDKTWNSFEVNQKLTRANDLNRRYGITNVPAIVVNGKYRTGGAEAGGHAKLLEVIDELVAREAAR